MLGQGEGEWGNWDAARSRGGLLSLALTAVGRALAVESDRWFRWLPVFFAAAIIAYFALSNEPQPRVAAALVLGAIGICLALRSAPLGLALAGAFLAFASGFATAKLRTEITRAPVLCARAALRRRKRLGRSPRASRQRARAAHYQGPLLGRSRARGTPLPRAGHDAGARCRQ